MSRVLRRLAERMSIAAKWGGGLVAKANASAFDKVHHSWLDGTECTRSRFVEGAPPTRDVRH